MMDGYGYADTIAISYPDLSLPPHRPAGVADLIAYAIAQMSPFGPAASSSECGDSSSPANYSTCSASGELGGRSR